MACPQCGKDGKTTVNSGFKEMRTRQEWKENSPSEGPGGYYINVHDGYDVTKLEVCTNCSHVFRSWVEKEG